MRSRVSSDWVDQAPISLDGNDGEGRAGKGERAWKGTDRQGAAYLGERASVQADMSKQQETAVDTESRSQLCRGN